MKSTQLFEAGIFFNYAIKIDKEEPLFYYFRALTKYQKIDYTGALEDYNKVLESSEVYLNGTNVHEAVRSMEVSKAVSIVATVPEVRHQLVTLQLMVRQL